MFIKRLVVLAFAVAIFTGCVTTDGARTPNQDKSQDFVKEKRSWDSPGI